MGPADALSCLPDPNTSSDNTDVTLLPNDLFIHAIDTALVDKITFFFCFWSPCPQYCKESLWWLPPLSSLFSYRFALWQIPPLFQKPPLCSHCRPSWPCDLCAFVPHFQTWRLLLHLFFVVLWLLVAGYVFLCSLFCSWLCSLPANED